MDSYKKPTLIKLSEPLKYLSPVNISDKPQNIDSFDHPRTSRIFVNEAWNFKTSPETENLIALLNRNSRENIVCFCRENVVWIICPSRRNFSHGIIFRQTDQWINIILLYIINILTSDCYWYVIFKKMKFWI